MGEFMGCKECFDDGQGGGKWRKKMDRANENTKDHTKAVGILGIAGLYAPIQDRWPVSQTQYVDAGEDIHDASPVRSNMWR